LIDLAPPDLIDWAQPDLNTDRVGSGLGLMMYPPSGCTFVSSNIKPFPFLK